MLAYHPVIYSLIILISAFLIIIVAVLICTAILSNGMFDWEKDNDLQIEKFQKVKEYKEIK